MKSNLIVHVSAAVLSLALAAPAVAQNASDEGASSGEIIVTARKRDERLLDVPVAISAMSAEALDRYSTNSLTAISQQVPSLVIAESQNQVGGTINLRGVGAGISNPSTEQAVTLNLDGVPISYGNAIRLGQIDLQRVEVLKGPQALFYGKNSPGGIISLVSQDPGDTLEMQVRAGYEFYAKQKYVEAIASGPLNDQFGMRLVGYYSKEDGWFRNLGPSLPNANPKLARTNNSEDVFLRGTAAFKSPDGDFRAKVKVNYGQRDRDGLGPTAQAQLFYCPTGSQQLSQGLTTDCKVDRYFTNVALTRAGSALDPTLGDGTPFTSSKQFLTSFSMDYDASDAITLSSVTGYYRLREQSVDSFSFSAFPYSAASNDLVAKALSQELRLTTDLDGPLNFMVGGFWQDAQFTSRQAFILDVPGVAAPILPGSTFYDVDTKATSVFGQARYQVFEQLELAAGARMSWETKKVSGTSFGLPFEVLNPKRKYNDFSPEVTLTYKPEEDMTIFASYREGFISGGFNTVPTALRTSARPTLPARDLSYAQSTAKGGEVGIKGYLAGRQVLFDLVGYYYKYKDLQLSRWDSVAVTQTTQNAGGAKVKGVEFSGTFRPDALPGLELRTSAAYNDAKYTDFVGGCYGGQSIAAGCNLLPRNPADPATYGTLANPYNGQDQAGQRLVRAPKWTFSAGGTYDFDLSEALGGSISLDTSYSDRYQTQTEASPFNFQNSFWLVNGSVKVHGADKGWELALIGRNLTNKLYRVSGSMAIFTAGQSGTVAPRPGDHFGAISTPRQVMLQVTLRNSLLGN